MFKTVIVTKHAPAGAWLRKRGITGDVISHVSDPAEVRGAHVIGNLPLYLAAEAAKVTMIMLPGRQSEQRHREMTLEEMEAAGAYLQTFRVRAED
jgi:putative CRISPR-associated protein (TIGR02620 family)